MTAIYVCVCVCANVAVCLAVCSPLPRQLPRAIYRALKFSLLIKHYSIAFTLFSSHKFYSRRAKSEEEAEQ